MKPITLILFLVLTVASAFAENGYDLWLRYYTIADRQLLKEYSNRLHSIYIEGNSPTIVAAKKELLTGLRGLLNKPINEAREKESSVVVKKSASGWDDKPAGAYLVKVENSKVFITSGSDVGLLYGVFAFLRSLQTSQFSSNQHLESAPKIANRILNHWDNLNRTVERGYAGISIWNWHTLPDYPDQRYIDYARANASIGINGTVVTNVNAHALMLSRSYLLKVKALADVFRPYGIRVYLTTRFSAPIELGGLSTADPLHDSVKLWWQDKAKEIYDLIPDFGGFLVKANSEGQPGPQTYNRSHTDGANMLADAVAPYGGIIMWRAFVYDVRVQKQHENFEARHGNEAEEIASADRFRQAYLEFMPYDGAFRDNVLIQVKNGPIDFQPREPFSPLFGAMKRTPVSMEFQITQEYLGQGTHLVFQAPLFQEVLKADTYAKGKNSTVAKVIDGSLFGHALSAIAGVSNIGNDINWTGHPFGQANWYAFGRLAWDYQLSSSEIADEWIRQTFSNEKRVVETISSIMMSSREAVVNYMTPLGLHHIMATGHHYGPGPWVNDLGRADWNPVYYHRADSFGIGFDRTARGSNALAQYAPQVAEKWKNVATCDEKYLLWFHHVSWKHRMKSGRTLWDELCTKYQQGVDTVRQMRTRWSELEGFIDPQRFRQVSMLLSIQEKEAVWWKDACLLYFQQFSRMPLPAHVEAARTTLDEYMKLKFPFAPGIGGNN